MSYIDPWMPHAYDAFVPLGMSEKTLRTIHQGVQLSAGRKIVEIIGWYTELDGMSSEEVEIYLAEQDGPVELRHPFVQYTNINFFWLSMSEKQRCMPPELAHYICSSFGSLEAFRWTFRGEAARCLTPDWIWLVRDAAGTLRIVTSGHLRSPMTDRSLLPVLCCSLAEHAYLFDYGPDRDKYVVNWLDRIANYTYAKDRLGL